MASAESSRPPPAATSGGANPRTAGAETSRGTKTPASLELPAPSTAVTRMLLSPRASGTRAAMNRPPVTAAATSLTSTVTGAASVTLPRTVTWSAPVMLPLAGEAMLSSGGVRARLTVPARSSARPTNSWSAPSLVTVIGGGQKAMPLSPSEHTNVTVASRLVQPFAFGPGVTVARIVGAVRSMLMRAPANAMFPARSTARPSVSCPAPSVVTVTGSLTVAIPDRASLALKRTVTSVRFQPAAFGGGSTDAAICGGVRSMLTLTEAPDVVPVRSDAVPLRTCPAPSWDTVIGRVQVATPLVESEQSNRTLTFVLFQPASLGAGSRVGLMI